MRNMLTPAGLLFIGISTVICSCASGIKSTSSPSPAMERIKPLLSDSLVQITMSAPDGSIHVAVQGKMLFAPGSARIDAKGQRALQPLGEMLYESDDFTMMVKGLADTLEITPSKYLNQWSLSAARAASIISVLTAAMREKMVEEKAAELRALKKLARHGRQDAISESAPPDPDFIAPPADSTRYVVILVNSL